MTTVAATTQSKNFASSFWSSDTSSQEILFKQNAKGSKTLNNLSQFYKEFMQLENEYARKFSSIVNKLELPKHEYSSTLKTSIDVFQEQCLKLGDSHTLQSRRVFESLQTPLQELISERRAREKAIEARVQNAWTTLLNLKAKCETKSQKYEDIWEEICNLKSRRLTLDHIEIQKLEEKIDSLKQKMFVIREENWNLVNTYNQSLENWSILWWESCNELQIEEEKRVRFVKANLWEFANIANMLCVEQDKYCDNIRTSLQDCSARKDIKAFVDQFGTGGELFAPLKFIDFTKNETRPLHESTTQSFDITQIPSLNKDHATKISNKKRNPPPVLDEATEVAFEMVGRSKEIFKELQEEAQKEASEMRLKVPKSDEEGLSEPSSYKVMSEYSNPTTQTSISSQSFDDSLTNNVTSRLNELTKSVHNVDKIDAIESQYKVHDTANFDNIDNLRESMIPVTKAEKQSKHKSISDKIRKAFTETPETHPSNFQYKQVLPTKKDKNEAKTTKAAKRLSNNSLMLSADTIKASRLMTPERRTSHSVRKSKSQYNMNSHNISPQNLPATSLEGFPIMSHCKALYNYHARLEEELSFKKRDILLVLHKQKDGWWFAENMSSKDSGLVPCNYLEELH